MGSILFDEQLKATEPTEREKYAKLLVESIRADSANSRLTSLSSLCAQFPLPSELSQEVDFDMSVAIEGASGAGDLKKMEGSSDTWYFSEKSLTSAYALHLLRTEEKDPIRLIAETVRDDCRIYPRPTDVSFFTDPPFSLSKREIQQALGMMELRPDMTDLRRCTASNGAIYLYSSLYMGEALAQTLTEWIEVGQRQNP